MSQKTPNARRYCSHMKSHNQVRGHRTGSSHSGAEEYEYPREKTQAKAKIVHAYITAAAMHASARTINAAVVALVVVLSCVVYQTKCSF